VYCGFRPWTIALVLYFGFRPRTISLNLSGTASFGLDAIVRKDGRSPIASVFYIRQDRKTKRQTDRQTKRQKLRDQYSFWPKVREVMVRKQAAKMSYLLEWLPWLKWSFKTDKQILMPYEPLVPVLWDSEYTVNLFLVRMSYLLRNTMGHFLFFSDLYFFKVNICFVLRCQKWRTIFLHWLAW